MTQSVEVIQFYTLLNSLLVILDAARLQKQIRIQPVRKMCLLVFLAFMCDDIRNSSLGISYDLPLKLENKSGNFSHLSFSVERQK